MVASIGLGFASPFVAVLLVDDTPALHGLMYEWFYGIPLNALGVTPLQYGSAIFASAASSS